MKRSIILVLIVLIVASCTIKMRRIRTESKYLEIRTEEVCTNEQYMEMAAIASKCVMDNEAFTSASWRAYWIISKAFKSYRKDPLERAMESFVKAIYLDDYTNYDGIASLSKLEENFETTGSIIDACFESPAGRVSCEQKTTYRTTMRTYVPFERNERWKRLTYVKCSDAAGDYKKKCGNH